MKKRNVYTAIAAASGMLILILDGKTALSGAAEGVGLCLNTLIPSLFPFFLLSILLTGALSGQAVPILRPAAALCRIPKGAESLLAIGLLGGYPVGAQNVALLYRSGQLSAPQAARMICFCNNAGPAFIFGILGTMFSNPRTTWFLWAIHILSALVVGILLPSDMEQEPVRPRSRKIQLTDALERAVKIMGLVCGWVVLVRMMIGFLERWFLWLLPMPVQTTICGILELSNGCIRLSRIDSENLRFILASALLSLGGICVTLQTASVADGISMKLYFPGKILQCCISILLSTILQPLIFTQAELYITILTPLAAIIGLFCVLTLRYFEKSSGIPSVVGV